MEVFMMREKDGRSKSCAFIRYFERRAADAACVTLHGSMALPGAARALVVKYADPSEPRTNSRSSSAASQSPTMLAQSATPSPMGSPPMMQGMQGMPMQPMPSGMQGGEWQQMQQLGLMGLSLPPNMGGAMMAPGSPLQMGMPGSPLQMGMGLPQMGLMAQHMQMQPQVPPFAMPPPAAQHALPPHMLTESQPHEQERQPRRQPQAQAQAPPSACGYLHSGADGLNAGSSPPPPPGAVATWALPPPPLAVLHMGGEAAEEEDVLPGCAAATSCAAQMAAVSLHEGGAQQGLGSWERLFVSNLPKHIAEQDLLHIFAPFGLVTELQLLRRADGGSKGSAFVAFQSAAEGFAACSMLARYILPGATRPMTIKFSTQKRDKSRGGNGGQHISDGSLVASDLHNLGSQQSTNASPSTSGSLSSYSD